MDSGLLSRWCMCINSHWCSKLCKVKNSLKIIISHQGFFFFLPIFCSFTKSWLWIKSCQTTGVLWHVTVGTETDQKYLCALEWGSEQNKSPASYLVSRAQMQFYHIWITSAYPPRSPVLEVFPLSSAQQRGPSSQPSCASIPSFAAWWTCPSLCSQGFPADLFIYFSG